MKCLVRTICIGHLLHSSLLPRLNFLVLCARKSVRCANDGICLLVDYKDPTGSTNPLDHLYGHAAYTHLNAMLFNTTEIVKALYKA